MPRVIRTLVAASAPVDREERRPIVTAAERKREFVYEDRRFPEGRFRAYVGNVRRAPSGAWIASNVDGEFDSRDAAIAACKARGVPWPASMRPKHGEPMGG